MTVVNAIANEINDRPRDQNYSLGDRPPFRPFSISRVRKMTYTWTGNGNDNLWDDPANWINNQGAIGPSAWPGTAEFDSAVIPVTATIVAPGPSAEMQMMSTLTVNSGVTLTLDGPGAVYTNFVTGLGTLVLNGAILDNGHEQGVGSSYLTPIIENGGEFVAMPNGAGAGPGANFGSNDGGGALPLNTYLVPGDTNPNDSAQLPINSFAPGDAIIFGDVSAGDSLTATGVAEGDGSSVVAVTDNTNPADDIAYFDITFAPGIAPNDVSAQVVAVPSYIDDDLGNPTTPVTYYEIELTVTCFLAGTRIMTPTGEVAIENLKVGDIVVTASGEQRPIKWLGHRRIDCTRHPDPSAVWPVCFRQDALANGKPARDLWVTPGHSFLFDGVLIQAEKLINGVTIVQQPRDRIEIWHIELDSHDIILAEGVPAESYLDTGNRRHGFMNGGTFLQLHPELEPKHWTETCMPLVFEGPHLNRAKTSILEVAAQRGHVTTAESDMHIIADGNRIEPAWLTETRAAFLLPAGCSQIELRSRRFVPTQCLPMSHDDRTLGVAVGRLQIDGSDVPIDDDATLSVGWHSFEQQESGRRQRWTNGDAPMPANARLIVIDVADRGHYWDDRKANVVDLFGRRSIR